MFYTITPVHSIVARLRAEATAAPACMNKQGQAALLVDRHARWPSLRGSPKSGFHSTVSMATSSAAAEHKQGAGEERRVRRPEQ